MGATCPDHLSAQDWKKIRMLALTKAFEARNERIRNDEKGFTLIELLVVVIIIGILAAIAIPVFLGQQDKAKDGAAKSDLANAQIQYVSNLVDAPSGSAGITGFTKSSNVTAVTNPLATGTTYCIQATSSSTAATIFKITQTGGVQTGAC